jgi:methanogenic corrinoid protein MtbC1
MSALCEAGMRPAEAAEIVKNERARAPKMQTESGEIRTSTLVDDMLTAITDNDFEGLRAHLDFAFASQSAAAAYDQHVSPLLARIGQLWAQGSLTIAQEHLASFTIRNLCAHYLRLVSPSHEAPVALLACADDEPHEIGLLGFGLHVASWGFRPITLGARVPVEALAESIAVHRPAFVGISLVLRPSDPDALFAAYARACANTPWVVGGPAASELAAVVKALEGHVLPSPPDGSLEPLLARWFRANVTGGPLSAAVRPISPR